MTLHRLAQVLAWLSLACSTALVWLAAGLFSAPPSGVMWMSPDMFGFLVNGFDRSSYTLALVAAILLLVWVAQRRQRAGFIPLLGVTILLAFTYDTGWHDLLVSRVLFPFGAFDPQSEAVEMALHSAPSTLLALLVIARSVVGGLAAHRAPAGIPADSTLEIYVESLRADAAE